MHYYNKSSPILGAGEGEDERMTAFDVALYQDRYQYGDDWRTVARVRDNGKYVRGSAKVELVPRKITEKRLKWYGHVRRRK